MLILRVRTKKNFGAFGAGEVKLEIRIKNDIFIIFWPFFENFDQKKCVLSEIRSRRGEIRIRRGELGTGSAN